MRRIRLHEASALLGLSPRGAQAMAARGEIPGAAKIGRVWTFDAAAKGLAQKTAQTKRINAAIPLTNKGESADD